MNGRNKHLILLKKRKVFFYYRCAFHQQGRLKNLAFFIYDLCTRFAIVTVTIMSGFPCVMFNNYSMSIVNQHTYCIGCQRNPVLLKSSFFWYPDKQFCTLRLHI